MDFLDVVAWSTAGLLCAYIAERKKKSTRLALFTGLLFGLFAVIYYSFCKSRSNDWKTKDSWLFFLTYFAFLIGMVFGYSAAHFL